MLDIEFSITGKHIIIKIPKQFYNNNEWRWLSFLIGICVFWGSEYNLCILWEKSLENFCITMILKIRFLDEKVAFTLEIRCRVPFHYYLTWGSFWFPKERGSGNWKFGLIVSLFLLWCTLVPMETTLKWLESDIYKCSVRSFLSNALKFKPGFVMYSEPSLTYSEGLWKDDILNAKTRHMIALCQFSESSTFSVYSKTKRVSFPQFASTRSW